MNNHSFAVKRKTGPCDETWDIEHLDYSHVVHEKDWENDKDAVLAKLRLDTARQIADMLLDKGFLDFTYDYDVITNRHVINHRLKVLRKKE
jgi:hypothetical protein